MKRIWTAFLVLIFCFIGTLSGVALANESNLSLPLARDGNIALSLKDDLTQADAAKAVQVFVGKPSACCDGRRPLAGQYRIEGQTIIFDPAFDLIEGQSYSVQTRDRATGASATITELVIKPQVEQVLPFVKAIYPSGDAIPENTLRFYIHFSKPMKPHMSEEFIRLVNENGVVDDQAFMAFSQELWNADRTRLTLLMDPGRIKRGVAQNLRLGPALEMGKRYSIVVKRGWPDA